jgi:ADP-heptose:LPS heptosyltransferase
MLRNAALQPPRNPARMQNILVVRQHNQLGDMLCVVPLLRALRERFPSSRIQLLTSPVNNAVMLHHRLLDGVINFDKREFLGDGKLRVGRLRQFVRELKENRFDLAIVPSTVSMSMTSDLLAYWSGASTRIGPGTLDGVKNKGRWLYTERVDLSWIDFPERHQTLRNLDIARSLGLDVPALDLEMTLLTEERARGQAEVQHIRSGARLVIAFHPGAGKVPNRWPTESFRSTIEQLYHRYSIRVAIVKGPMDEEPVQALVCSLAVPYYLIEKRSIREVASILTSVDLLISNDTGIMHVGAAAGIPVLSLFGPTDPRQWAPPGERNRYIKGESGNIADIRVDSVLELARKMLPEHR